MSSAVPSPQLSSSRSSASGQANQRQLGAEMAVQQGNHAERRSDRRATDDTGKWERRRSDRWLERWMQTTRDLARLQYSHRMVDAVIDEVDGRRIRIGDHWLTDYASCNYLGFDLDEEIIAAVPESLARWGTHPSWSRLLGSPVLYDELDAELTELLAAEASLVLP